MFEELKHKLFSIKKVIGAELIIQADGTYSIRFIQLFVKDELIQSGSHNFKLLTINQLKNSIDEDVPVCLIINGKGVFQKKVDLKELSSGHKLQAILPKASTNDFYL